jgi:hypothetical protein
LYGMIPSFASITALPQPWMRAAQVTRTSRSSGEPYWIIASRMSLLSFTSPSWVSTRPMRKS